MAFKIKLDMMVDLRINNKYYNIYISMTLYPDARLQWLARGKNLSVELSGTMGLGATTLFFRNKQ